jgi:hypothetical protein
MLAAMTNLTFPAGTRSFSQHVAFDNLPVGEATKSNTPALSLIAKHAGYCSNKRSRLFMVGVDEHSYSDYALVWMMDQLVDDGDEVICVRVVDVPIRTAEKYYRSEAAKILEAIQEKNMHDRAISITLEYAVGKLHATFQKLVGFLTNHGAHPGKLWLRIAVWPSLTFLPRSIRTSLPC